MVAKGFLFISLLAGFCVSCNPDVEKAQLEQRLIAVRSELEASRKHIETLIEIGQLIDSIDHNRYDVLVDWRVGPSPFNKYKFRLSAINQYVSQSERRLQHLQEQLDKVSLETHEDDKVLIAKLNSRIQKRRHEIRRLKDLLLKSKEENTFLSSRMSEQKIQLEQNGIRLLEQSSELDILTERIAAAREAYEAVEAQACFGQGLAMETLAQRTHFAASRKREALEQALIYYRQALAFGKEEAKPKVIALERRLE